MNEILYSSASEEWETPYNFYSKLWVFFQFDLDACATATNRKTYKFYSKEDDALSIPEWDSKTCVWCNPPYGRKIVEWVKKCDEQHRVYNRSVVMLIPARTDTKYFHDYIYGKYPVLFVRGRLHFNGSKHAAPFPSMLVFMVNEMFLQKMRGGVLSKNINGGENK